MKYVAVIVIPTLPMFVMAFDTEAEYDAVMKVGEHFWVDDEDVHFGGMRLEDKNED